MWDKTAKGEREIARIAARQHGVITAAQLEGLGLSRTSISRWTDAGRLHRMHRGVYAVGHPGLSRHRLWMAAVLAGGDGAVLSHTSAAALLRLLKPFRGPIHITSPSPNGRSRRSGIVVHRSPSLTSDASPQVTQRDGIPVTTPQRTIEDLRTSVTPHLQRRAIRQAELAGYRLDHATMSRTQRTRSDLELDFLRFCSGHGFPRPEVNVQVGAWTVDFLWRARRVVVETDFFDYHKGSAAFEDDHQRELDLRRAGYIVRRFTGAQIRNHPTLVVADLSEALGGAHGQ